MFQYRKAVLTVVALAALLASPADAAPQGNKVKLTELCTGEETDLILSPVPMLEFAGKGISSVIGPYTISGGHVFNPDTGELSGVFTQTALDGSTLSGTYEGIFYEAVEGSGVFVFEVSVTYSVGTDKLEGVTGEASVEAVLFGDQPGSPLAYTTEGFLRVP
jgi:hypothetical protein